MRHRVAGYKLGRSRGHRTALRRTLVTEFFRHERIKTTRTKAAAIRDEAERLITTAKRRRRRRRVAGGLGPPFGRRPPQRSPGRQEAVRRDRPALRRASRRLHPCRQARAAAGDAAEMVYPRAGRRIGPPLSLRGVPSRSRDAVAIAPNGEIARPPRPSAHTQGAPEGVPEGVKPAARNDGKSTGRGNLPIDPRLRRNRFRRLPAAAATTHGAGRSRAGAAHSWDGARRHCAAPDEPTPASTPPARSWPTSWSGGATCSA